ncbi:MAG: RagB/SusD family nutrient uptake outer membrane protein [Bacteroidales bacterium]|nr:RagB/SusD family nutrient uptake outer membrane protein [Bacteroidales bacterium]
MKRYFYTIGVLACLIAFSGCNKWLSEPQPARPGLEEFFASGGAAAIQVVNGAYVPVQWEYGSTYSSEWWIGDVASDDALKGGQNVSDMSAGFELDNFRVSDNNAILLDMYQMNYQGVARCNLAIEQIPLIAPDSIMTESVKQRLIGEAKFLRAFYYFRLVRIFQELPLVTVTIKSSSEWKQPKATAEKIYERIVADLLDANSKLWTLSQIRANPSEIGRATKGAAQALLLKAYLYQGQYAQAKQWGDSIINSGQYGLEPRYSDNFSIYNENGIESVFEAQYSEEASSDYGSFNPHFGGTRGTFTTVLTRSRSTKMPKLASGGAAKGWGFNKPTQSLYNEFEDGDIRRDASILNLPDSMMSNTNEEIYLGCRYLSRKYALMDDNNNALWNGHETRSPINIKLIRYADVLLMYAEACNELGDIAGATATLNYLRSVRRSECANPATQLPDFPYGSYGSNQNDMRLALRHERRVELAMEGHRWFDIVRWGIAKQVMDDYKQNETAAVQAEMGTFVKGKNEYFPLPQYELDLSGLEQNNRFK